MADPALSARDVTVVREGASVLSQLNFSVAPGDRVALLGPNGAGKSTLLKAIAGIIPYQGALTLFGHEVSRLPARERARLCAYVPQHSALAAPLTVAAVVEQGRYSHRAPGRGLARADREAIDHALALVDLTAYADRSFTQLSYGERRRVLLARALATAAPLILLDEPTAALDIGHALDLFTVLARLADQGQTIVVVLHQLSEAATFARVALLLDRGRLEASGPTGDVLAPDPIRRVYGVNLRAHAAFGYERAPRDKEPAP